jgi:hypothetical protein
MAIDPTKVNIASQPNSSDFRAWFGCAIVKLAQIAANCEAWLNAEQ